MNEVMDQMLVKECSVMYVVGNMLLSRSITSLGSSYKTISLDNEAVLKNLPEDHSSQFVTYSSCLFYVV